MNITKSRPFYAVAGAGDLAVKALREVPTRLGTLMIDRKDIESTLTTLQVGTLALPAKAKALPAKAQTAAVGVVGGVADTADAVYGDLVSRGRSIVTRVRRQQASQDLKTRATTTVRRAKGASTTAKKSVDDTRSAAKGTVTRAENSAAATRSSAKGTVTTARKNAAATRTATKSATTSARRTAAQAVQATTDGAAKVGA